MPPEACRSVGPVRLVLRSGSWPVALQLLAREMAFEDPLTGAARRFLSEQRLALAGG